MRNQTNFEQELWLQQLAEEIALTAHKKAHQAKLEKNDLPSWGENVDRTFEYKGKSIVGKDLNDKVVRAELGIENDDIARNLKANQLLLKHMNIIHKALDLKVNGIRLDDKHSLAELVFRGGGVTLDLSALDKEHLNKLKDYLSLATLEKRIYSSHGIGATQGSEESSLIYFNIANKIKSLTNNLTQWGHNVALGGVETTVAAHPAIFPKGRPGERVRANGEHGHLLLTMHQGPAGLQLRIGLEGSAPKKGNALTGAHHGMTAKPDSHSGVGARKFNEEEVITASLKAGKVPTAAGKHLKKGYAVIKLSNDDINTITDGPQLAAKEWWQAPKSAASYSSPEFRSLAYGLGQRYAKANKQASKSYTYSVLDGMFLGALAFTAVAGALAAVAATGGLALAGALAIFGLAKLFTASAVTGAVVGATTSAAKTKIKHIKGNKALHKMQGELTSLDEATKPQPTASPEVVEATARLTTALADTPEQSPTHTAETGVADDTQEMATAKRLSKGPTLFSERYQKEQPELQVELDEACPLIASY